MQIERLRESDERARSDSTAILIVEDDEAEAARLVRLIGRMPGRECRILRAARLSEALELIALHQPDVALVTGGLPDATEDQAVRTVASCAPYCAVIVEADEPLTSVELDRSISHSIERLSHTAMLRRMWDLVGESPPIRRRSGPLRLQTAIRVACSDVAEQVAVAGGGIRVDVDESIAVDADMGGLRPVFVNLLTNSIEFRRPDVALEIRIAARRVDGAVIVRIEDNGVGVPADAADSVFEILEQLDRTDTDGLGFGLPIARRLLEQVGGSIRIEPKKGPGTVVVIELRSLLLPP